ncbi:mechanosensitive ion channel family protein [Kordiimonas gwangyangensis]
MITQPVINWSHSHRLVRRRIPVQVSYESDIRRAMELMVEAAGEESRVLSSPEPRTLLKNFGADGVDLELRMWIEDPQNGVSNIASDVMLHIWDKFHEEGIEFPYPQRVVHFKTDGPLPKIAVVPPNYEEGELETDEAILAEAEAGKAEKTDGENKAD